MKYVTITRDYQCNFCLASVNDKEVMVAHLKKYHGQAIKVCDKWEKDHPK